MQVRPAKQINITKENLFRNGSRKMNMKKSSLWEANLQQAHRLASSPELLLLDRQALVHLHENTPRWKALGNISLQQARFAASHSPLPRSFRSTLQVRVKSQLGQTPVLTCPDRFDTFLRRNIQTRIALPVLPVLLALSVHRALPLSISIDLLLPQLLFSGLWDLLVLRAVIVARPYLSGSVVVASGGGSEWYRWEWRRLLKSDGCWAKEGANRHSYGMECPCL